MSGSEETLFAHQKKQHDMKRKTPDLVSIQKQIAEFSYYYPSAAEVLNEFNYLKDAPNPQYTKPVTKKTTDFKNRERFVSDVNDDGTTGDQWKSGKVKYATRDIAAFAVDESTMRADANGVGPNNSNNAPKSNEKEGNMGSRMPHWTNSHLEDAGKGKKGMSTKDGGSKDPSGGDSEVDPAAAEKRKAEEAQKRKGYEQARLRVGTLQRFMFLLEELTSPVAIEWATPAADDAERAQAKTNTGVNKKHNGEESTFSDRLVVSHSDNLALPPIDGATPPPPAEESTESEDKANDEDPEGRDSPDDKVKKTAGAEEESGAVAEGTSANPTTHKAKAKDQKLKQLKVAGTGRDQLLPGAMLETIKEEEVADLDEAGVAKYERRMRADKGADGEINNMSSEHTSIMSWAKWKTSSV